MGLDEGERGPPFSTDLLWSILNASVLALLDKTQRDNESEFEDCWMCFSASPPFYEGIALFGNFTLLSDARQLPFESAYLDRTLWDRKLCVGPRHASAAALARDLQ